MNQYLYSFLKKMSSSNKIPPNGKLQPLFKILAKATRLFHMNELEVVVWSLWLDTLYWTIDDSSLETTIIIAAMQTKEHLNEEEVIKIYKNELNSNYSDIMEKYEAWMKDKDHEINVGITDINRRYTEFRQVKFYYKL